MLRLILLSLISFNVISATEPSPILTRECEAFSANLAEQLNPTKLIEDNSQEELIELSFKFNELSYRKSNDEIHLIDIVPDIALPVENGWLLGAHLGRRNGGALVLKKSSGELQIIIRDVVEDIYKYPYGYIVTTGVRYHSDLDGSRGAIYLVTIKDKEYLSQKLHSLIASPETSWLTSDWDLLINHRGHPSTVFTADGKLYRVNCKNLASE